MADSVKKEKEKPKQQGGKKAGDKKKGCAKKGANSLRCARYRDRNHFELNKLKRIIWSNGGDAAVAWAKMREMQEKNLFLTPVLKSLRTLKPRAFQRAVEKSTAFAKAVGVTK